MNRFAFVRICLLLVSVATRLPAADAPAAPGADHLTVASSEHAGGDHGTVTVPAAAPNPLSFDVDLAAWTGIIFLVLLGVLRAFAWGPISKALEDREKSITDNLAAAAAKHDEAKQLLMSYEAKLVTAKAEVREILDEARRDAEATKGQILAEATEAATAQRERAVRDIEVARDSAVRQLAETSANIAVDLAGKVLRQNLGGEQQGQLVREALTRLGNGAPSNN